MTAAEAGSTVRGFQWYGRREAVGWWRIAACAEHGRELRRHRFTALGRATAFTGVGDRIARACSVCENPGLRTEVEHCTCEGDPARCPVHQNVGCGG